MSFKKEDYMPLNNVPAVIRNLTGVGVCRDTIYKWVKTGKATQYGTKTRLKAKKRLGHYYTTKLWIEEFIQEVG